MRRCLIAIFALHFFLSVSAFAFGGAGSARATQSRAAAVLQAVPAGLEATAQQGMALAESSVKHVLVDPVPDLPESLPRALLIQRPPVDGGSTIGYRQRAVLPPSLDGLLRPPQHAAPPA